MTTVGLPPDYVGTVARPHSARTRIGSYPITGSVTARYADMDPNAHLNNVALESLSSVLFVDDACVSVCDRYRAPARSPQSQDQRNHSHRIPMCRVADTDA